MRRLKFVALVSAVSLVLGELAAQLSGGVDVPTYVANSEIGYIPSPNQSGSFAHIHTWRFNEFSMGAGPFTPQPGRFNLLLIGDSIVLGGNPLAEPERLGPQLEKLSGWQVWPISAGSWALQNELTYLRLHPQVLDKVDAVAIISNSGDFGQPSSWASDLTHPLHRPFPASLYLAKKYIIHPDATVAPEMKVAARDWRADLHGFSLSFHKPIFVFMYPNRAELRDGSKIETQLYAKIPLMQAQAGGEARIFRVAEASQWNEELYRDAVHPSGAGNAVLAEIIRKDICQSGVADLACQ